MGNKSGFLQKMEARHQLELRRMREFSLQYCLDAALIAVNDVFGAGEKRILDFMDAYNRSIEEISRVVMQDARDDKECVYAKAKVDQKLQQICGKHFLPWDERYK